MSARLERDIENFARQHPGGITVRDMGDFRARLPTRGHKLEAVESSVRHLRNRGRIRLKKVDGGTTVKPGGVLLNA